MEALLSIKSMEGPKYPFLKNFNTTINAVQFFHFDPA